ncbi:MAG: hypothetical protein Q9226_006527, partial [Calogaya cf. arnoldii]
KRPPVSLLLALMLSPACGIADVAEVEIGGDGTAIFDGSMKVVVGDLDEEDTADELAVDRYPVERLAGGGAENVSLLVSMYQPRIAKEKTPWARQGKTVDSLQYLGHTVAL